MDQLLALRPVASDDLQQLRDMYDIIEIHTRNLLNFNVKAKSYGPVLNSVVMSKLPRNIRLVISRQMPDGKWDVCKLMDVFKRELVARERCEQFESLSYQNDAEHNISSTLHVNTPRSVTCSYCKGDHKSLNCNIVTDIKARKAHLREKNKCFNCLDESHYVKECYSKYVCFNCKGRHHVSICPTLKSNNPLAQKQLTANVDKGLPGQQTSDETLRRTTTSSMVISLQDNTLLQTAEARIMNVDGNRCTQTARILFDNCSQKSFITEDLRRRLKLNPIRREKLSIKAFGSTEETFETLNVVRVNIGSLCGGGYRVVEVYAVPKICSPVSSQRIEGAVEKYPLLKELQLADQKIHLHEKEVNILIGADHYWSFATGRIVHIDEGLVAIDTILGWCLSGSFKPNNGNKATVNHISSHVLKVACDKIENKVINDKSFEHFWLEFIYVTIISQ